MKTEVIIVIISSIVVFIGIPVFIRNWKLSKTGIKTIATITGNFHAAAEDSYDNGRHTKTFYPLIEFTTVKGMVINGQLDSGSSIEKVIGKKIKIIYDSDNPDLFKSDSFVVLFLVPGIVFFIGILGNVWGFLEMNGVLNLLID